MPLASRSGRPFHQGTHRSDLVEVLKCAATILADGAGRRQSTTATVHKGGGEAGANSVYRARAGHADAGTVSDAAMAGPSGAACSWRTSMPRMPLSIAAFSADDMGAPMIRRCVDALLL